MRKTARPLAAAVLTICTAAAGAQESYVDGDSLLTPNTQITSTSNEWLVYTPTALPIGTGVWNCAVTASADVWNPMSGKDNRYFFGLSHNTLGSTEAGSDRTIEFDYRSSHEEVEKVEVTTTFVFKNLSTAPGLNTHTFYFMARKKSSGDADLSVDDSSISVICSDYPD